MIINAGTSEIESAGKVHDMSEKVWDFVMYECLLASLHFPQPVLMKHPNMLTSRLPLPA